MAVTLHGVYMVNRGSLIRQELIDVAVVFVAQAGIKARLEVLPKASEE